MIEAEEEDKPDCFVNNLPPEVLSDILEHLCISDQLVCRSVSGQWRQAIEATSLHDKTQVCVSSEKLQDNESLENVLQVFAGDGGHKNFKFSNLSLSCEAKFWRSKGEGLVSLELVDCEVGERDLVLILNSTTSLKHLSLIQCREALMSGGFMQHQEDCASLSRSLEGLQTLVLDNNTYLSDVLLLRFISVAKSLRSLSLSGCNIINHPGIYAKYYPENQNIEASPSVLTWRTVLKVVGLLSRTLRHLGLCRNSGVDLRSLAGVEGLQLESIDISGCTSVDEIAFSHFVESQQKLRKVELAGCRRVFSGLSGASSIMFKAMEKVEELTLNELSMPHFDKISAIKNIKVLKIDSLDSPGSKVFAGFQSLNVSKLRRLQAKFLSVSPEHACSIFSLGMPSLTHLDIVEGSVTDEVVQAICENLLHLEHLNLAGNPSITDMGTLGIDNTCTYSTKDIFQQRGPIPLGSKTEQDVAFMGRRQMAVNEILNSTQDPDLKRVSPLKRLKNLQFLSLRGSSITSLTLLVALEAPNLRHLDLSNCIGVDDVGLQDAAAKHPRLEKLELVGSPLSDSGLLYCLSCLPRLSHLDVRNCPSLSSQGVSSLPLVAPQLTSLLLSHCPSVSKEAARALATDLPYMRRLDSRDLGSGLPFQVVAAPPPPPPPTSM